MSASLAVDAIKDFAPQETVEVALPVPYHLSTQPDFHRALELAFSLGIQAETRPRMFVRSIMLVLSGPQSQLSLFLGELARLEMSALVAR